MTAKTVEERVNADTVELIKECDAGVKTAVKSIDEVLDTVVDNEMKKMLIENKKDHEKIQNEIDKLLDKYNKEGKEPSPMAKAMSWTKINIKIMTDKSDKTVADLITEGCNMGIKTLNKYKNQYGKADKEAVSIADKLIQLEEQLAFKLRRFL